MDQKQSVILQDIDQTRAELTAKIGQLEGQVRDTVETAKATVEGTIENIKGNIKGTVENVKKTIDPIRQTKEHPWIMVGASAATGIFLGAWLSKIRNENNAPRVPSRAEVTAATEPQMSGDFYAAAKAPAEPTLMSRLFSQFDDEIQMVKGIAAGAVLHKVSEFAEKQFPDLKPKIDEVIKSAEAKIAAKRPPAPTADVDWQDKSTGNEKAI